MSIGNRAVAMTTDPVFIVPEYGFKKAAWFAIHILVSDVVTSGLPPAYLTIDLNLPMAMNEQELATIWTTIDEECKKMGIAIIAGHTARYENCHYPMVGGATVIAVGDLDQYVSPKFARAGDKIIITKGPAIEASGIFATMFPKLLKRKFGAAFAQKAATLFYKMSVVEDALTAVKVGVRDKGVSAMHDATECGIWGGLYEIARAAELGVRIEKEKIVIEAGVQEICDFFEIDPFKSISEGTLIISCREHKAEKVVTMLQAKGITAGGYRIEVPMHGVFKVVYQFIGYQTETLTVAVGHGERVKRNVQLRAVSLPMPEVQTSARRQTVHESKTPEPTIIIPQTAAEQAGKSTIGEALTLETGIQLQKKCIACEATEVSIQGLPGRFARILFEGMPLFSDLAGRYILDLVPVEFINQLEVLKGASGALWGTDAVAGAVNIRLIEPARPLEANASYTRRSYGNDLSLRLGSNFKPLAIGMIGAHSDRRPVDFNNDTIAENTAYQRRMVLTTVNYFPGIHWRLTGGGSLADEQRRSGAIISDSEYYTNPLAEKVRTRRWDSWGRTSFTADASELSFKIAAANHQETGFIAMRDYNARQFNFYADITGTVPRFSTGVAISRQILSDSRLFTQRYAETDFGIWASGNNLSLPLIPIANEVLPAFRLDFNSDYGTILSPYGAIKLYPGFADLSLVAGSGFRTPTIIWESMENLPAGYRYAFSRAPDLTRESGLSLQAGAARTFITGNRAATVRLNLFHHQVGNFITAEFQGIDSSTGQALFYYHNLKGRAFSTGAELSTTINLLPAVTATINTYALLPRNETGQTLPFIKRWGINYTLNYQTPRWGMAGNITGEVNGPMLVQRVDKNGEIDVHNSPVYSILNLSLSKTVGFFRLTAGINNLGNYYQPPLSPHDHTEYYWGPIIGRELYATISLSI
ncbi:MAG: AIR synthase-related protein [candidate division WOR-3 bacterium]